jgi:hypothetical protein
MNRLKTAFAALLMASLILFTGQVKAGHLDLTPGEVLATKQTSNKPVSGGALKFDLSNIPEGSRIDLAELNLVVSSDTGLGQTLEVFAGASTESWSGSLTPMPGKIQTVDTLLASAYVATGENQTVQIDVTELVRLWFTGKLPNNGLSITIPVDGTKVFTLAATGGQVTARLSIFFSR